MSDIIKFIDLDWRNGMLFMAAVIIVAVFILQKTEWLASKFGITSKRQLAEDKRDQEILELKEHAKKTDGNFDKIGNSLNDLQQFVRNLSSQVETMQKRNDENEAARIKDRVAQAYRYFHQTGKITMMEKEALEDNIKAYSQYSQNSFIHSVIEREMPTWQIVDEHKE